MVKNKPIGKPARNKWIKATEDPSLSPGKRIRLFCEISRQADKIIEEDKTENAEETIRSEIAKLCSSTASKARINEQQVGQYLRLCYLSNDEVRKLAKDADCNDPIEKPEEKPRYCSRMSISHALLLAAVENKERREQLLVEAIANHWPHKVLKAESSADRINSLDYRRKLVFGDNYFSPLATIRIPFS